MHTIVNDRDVYATTQTSHLTTERCLCHNTDITPHDREMSMPLHRHRTSRQKDAYTITQPSYLTVREGCLYHYTDIIPHERDVHYTDTMLHNRDVSTTTQTSHLTREISIPLQTSCLMTEMSIPLHTYHT